MPRTHRRVLAWVFAGLALLPWPGYAQPSRAERAVILDTIRPLAAQRAGQAVRIKVERLNLDAGWALLTGELVSPTGQALAWQQAPGCHPELDKLLWVVLAKVKGRWRVRHLEVCATEPPHWYLPAYGGFRWPCGVFLGLQGPEGQDLQQACLDQAGAQRGRPGAGPQRRQTPA